MKWFHGSIPNAIQAAKDKRAVFIVYISSDDDESTQMSEVWKDPAVSNLSESERCVGLWLQSESESCAQFGQIYPLLCIPCTFFIGNNGVPLEVVGGSVKPADFCKKMKKAIQMHNKALGIQPSSEGASAGPLSNAASSSVDDCEEKARQVVGRVIQESKRMKAQKDKEDEKESEKQRRELGADMQRFTKAKCEIEAEEIKQARIKERQEEKVARERVRKQIAADKADRIARNQEREGWKQEYSPTQPTTTTTNRQVSDSTRMKVTRLQFRLPDGSTVTSQFRSSQLLSDARNFIQPRVASLGAFTLSTTYPKHLFTDAEMSESLLDLNLAPSAALVVLPHSSALSSVTGLGGTNLLMILLTPFITMWGYVYNFLFGHPQNPGGAYNPQQGTAARGSRQNEGTSTSTSRRPMSSVGPRSRVERNIHRLSGEDSDDEQATWNGNSTQQM